MPIRTLWIWDEPDIKLQSPTDINEGDVCNLSGTANNGSTVPEISQETKDTIEKKTENDPKSKEIEITSPVGITVCDWDANTCKKETVKSVSTPKKKSNPSKEIQKNRSSVTWYTDTQEKHQDVETNKLAESGNKGCRVY